MPLSPRDPQAHPKRPARPPLPSSGHSIDDVREMADCEHHGPYLVRAGSVRCMVAHNPGGCPQCLQAARTSALLDSANIPPRFADCEFANFSASTDAQRKVLKACQAYADHFGDNLAQGRGLIMLGNPGTGKNHLATAICKAVKAAGHSTLRVKASEFLDAYWAKDFDERGAWVHELAAVHLIVLDEVGRSSSTDNAQNAFFRLIDARYEAVRPTIVLSNLNRQGVIDVLGDAAYDRLTEAGSQRLTFDWSSHRATTTRGAQA